MVVPQIADADSMMFWAVNSGGVCVFANARLRGVPDASHGVSSGSIAAAHAAGRMPISDANFSAIAANRLSMRREPDAVGGSAVATAVSSGCKTIWSTSRDLRAPNSGSWVLGRHNDLIHSSHVSHYRNPKTSNRRLRRRFLRAAYSAT